MPADPKALTDLLTIIEHENIGDVCQDEPDDEPVSLYGDGRPSPLTFGHIRRARAMLDTLRTPKSDQNTRADIARLRALLEKTIAKDGSTDEDRAAIVAGLNLLEGLCINVATIASAMAHLATRL